MVWISMILVTGMGAQSEANALQPPVVRVCGPWEIEVSPGVLVVQGHETRVEQGVPLAVRPPEFVNVENECHVDLPIFDDKAAPWRKGAPLKRLITAECTATDLLDPDSIRVKSLPDSDRFLTNETDFRFDPMWGTVGRIDGGQILPRQTVYIDYLYSPCRLDSVVVDMDGRVRIVEGKSGVGAMLPPDPGQGVSVLANVWIPGRTQSLTDENLYPVESLPDIAPAPVAEKLLPRTLEKLREGEAVTIVAWGDSVTHGGGVNGFEAHWYQNQFVRALAARFPTASIRMLTAAWPGAGSKRYMEEPPGGTYDYQRDVLDPKPDLVTIEFVNDAYMTEDETIAHYSAIIDRLRANGSEVAIITPHLVRPDWLKVTSMKLDEDPRPLVAGLRKCAEQKQVALADASREWCRLWRKGIPHITLQSNSINHPDVRGHKIFADSLMALFPER